MMALLMNSSWRHQSGIYFPRFYRYHERSSHFPSPYLEIVMDSHSPPLPALSLSASPYSSSRGSLPASRSLMSFHSHVRTPHRAHVCLCRTCPPAFGQGPQSAQHGADLLLTPLTFLGGIFIRQYAAADVAKRDTTKPGILYDRRSSLGILWCLRHQSVNDLIITSTVLVLSILILRRMFPNRLPIEELVISPIRVRCWRRRDCDGRRRRGRRLRERACAFHDAP